MTWLFSEPMMRLYGSLPCSPEQEAGSSPATCLDGSASAPLSVMPTPQPFWHNDKPIDVCRRSPYGLTWRRLTEADGEAVLMSFLEDFPARTSALPARETDSTVPDPDCGFTSRESFARYDRASHTWRTRQPSLLEDSIECLPTLPRWGSMRNGELSARPLSALPTFARGSGLLLSTPMAKDGEDAGGPGYWSLPRAMKDGLIPTPTAGDAKASGSRNTDQSAAHPGTSLTDWLHQDGGTGRTLPPRQLVPTPAATDWKGSNREGQRRGQLTDPAKGVVPAAAKLNPQFHCWMMGWDHDWTSIQPIGGDCDPALHRNHRLKASGNGQVPLAAVAAWRILTEGA